MRGIIKKKSFWINTFFVVLLIAIGAYYGYCDSTFYRPQSFHAWRQADCASIALNYYQDNTNIFQPQVHNQTSDGGTTGFSATSEMPILYYGVSILYRIFGPHEYLIRIINLIVFFLGLFALYKLVYEILQNYFWAIIVSLVVFVSPVLVYYGNNYLTNVSSLSFVFIAWYYLWHFLKTESFKKLLIALVFFMFAGIFKVPSLMSFFAICAVFVLKLFFKNKFFPTLKFRSVLLMLLGSLVLLLPIGGWILYAHHYNNVHDCYYFSTTVFPIWDIDVERLNKILTQVWELWRLEYFHDSMHILFALVCVFVLWKIRRIPAPYVWIGFFLLLQILIYVCLQFQTFYNHDYYTINLNILPIYLLIIGLFILKRDYSKLFNSTYLKIVFVLLLAYNINHAAGKQEFRYNDWPNDYFKNKESVYTLEPYLRSIGIKQSDKVIFLKDWSNVSLYLMNQKGWTQYSDARFGRQERILYNQDSHGIKMSIDRGAKYLIVNSYQDLMDSEFVLPWARNLVGKYGDVLIFDLIDTTQNFYPNRVVVNDYIFCDAEICKDGLLMSKDSLYALSSEKQLSIDKAFKSNRSCFVNKDNPYAFSYTFAQGCNAGDVFNVKVWRYGNENSTIIASGPVGVDFYENEIRVIEEEDGWELLEISFVLPKKMDKKELKVFVFNPEEVGAWFDDFELTRSSQRFVD